MMSDAQHDIGGQIVSGVATPDRKFRAAWAYDGEQVTIDWAAAVSQFRATASISKVDFCLSLASAGILTRAQAVEAAKGGWPAAFAAALSEAPEAESMEAEIRWAAASTIDRREPMLQSLATEAGVTDEQLDAIFGYDGEYPQS